MKDMFFHCSGLCGLKVLRSLSLRAGFLKLDALAASTRNLFGYLFFRRIVNHPCVVSQMAKAQGADRYTNLPVHSGYSHRESPLCS